EERYRLAPPRRERLSPIAPSGVSVGRQRAAASNGLSAGGGGGWLISKQGGPPPLAGVLGFRGGRRGEFFGVQPRTPHPSGASPLECTLRVKAQAPVANVPHRCERHGTIASRRPGGPVGSWRPTGTGDPRRPAGPATTGQGCRAGGA